MLLSTAEKSGTNRSKRTGQLEWGCQRTNARQWIRTASNYAKQLRNYTSAPFRTTRNEFYLTVIMERQVPTKISYLSAGRNGETNEETEILGIKACLRLKLLNR